MPRPKVDDDEDDFRVQALPVSGAPVSLDGPPTSAEEYLRRVKCATDSHAAAAAAEPFSR